MKKKKKKWWRCKMTKKKVGGEREKRNRALLQRLQQAEGREEGSGKVKWIQDIEKDLRDDETKTRRWWGGGWLLPNYFYNKYSYILNTRVFRIDTDVISTQQTMENVFRDWNYVVIKASISSFSFTPQYIQLCTSINDVPSPPPFLSYIY